MMLLDMIEYLQQYGIAYPLFAGNMPPSPASCMALFEYAGLLPQDGYTETPAMQILCRAESYAEGYAQLDAADNAITAIGLETGPLPGGVEINGTKYLLAYSTASGVNQLGKDENGCHLFSKNYYIVKEDR